MASILVPFAYIIVVFGALFIFSHYYRKHTSAQTFEPYFPSHPERNTYVTLLQKTDPPTPDALLKAALVRRAVADVHRVIRIREDKPALQNLLQKGSVGDELWNSLLAAERELEGEVMEVVTEANSFLEGWGQMIFGTANEIIANDKIRATLEQIPQNKADLGINEIRREGTPCAHTSSTGAGSPFIYFPQNISGVDKYDKPKVNEWSPTATPQQQCRKYCLQRW
ncbi:uncharacterized protein ARMOST_03632 [Armillaria ostoyae]|uniref:Translocation protein sec66 n=1 Tax=Armillaria ostoyae TaxID=47428 RepID=A0A284QV26_ARMOS|nr:uncharacterized protein ARMOST_03632 [Armillaria ostoyae]